MGRHLYIYPTGWVGYPTGWVSWLGNTEHKFCNLQKKAGNRLPHKVQLTT